MKNLIAFRMKIFPGAEIEYEKRHREIWPELSALLKENGVENYSIFLDKESSMLFAIQETSGESSSQDLGDNPIVRRWWAYMADLMETNADNSPVSVPLKEVFKFE